MADRGDCGVGGNKLKIVYGILSFLNEEFQNDHTSSDSKESLEVAMQCLETAFGITLRDTMYRPAQSLNELFAGPSVNRAANVGTTETPTQPPWVGKNRYNRPAPANEESKKSADSLKNDGNEKMKVGDFNNALECYNRAIALDGENAVYFCNRAAAFLKLDKLELAIRDCQVAIELHPSYARAFGRLGVLYSTIGKNKEAIQCYRRASELEPNNESYANNLKVAEEQIGPQGFAPSGQSGVNPGGIDFQNLMMNPNLLSMARVMLQDQGLQTLMRNIISGPTDGAGAASLDETGLQNLFQMGHEIADRIRETNPSLAEQIAENLGTRNDDSGNQPDSTGGNNF